MSTNEASRPELLAPAGGGGAASEPAWGEGSGCRGQLGRTAGTRGETTLPRMRALGLRHFRIELLRETAEQVRPLLEQYGRVLAGLDNGRETWRQLQARNQLGVTRGTLQLV